MFEIGSFNASNAPFAAGANISGSYLQHMLQNKSGTAGASTNYILSNDLGTDSTYYGEFGMNSSVYASGTYVDFFSMNNGIYFSAHDGDVTIGSGNGFKTYFAWGTAGQSAHVINASGAIGLNTNLGTTAATTGTTNFGTAGQVLTSQGSAATPTWTNASTGTVTSVSALTLGTTGTDLSSTVATGTSTPVITLNVPTASATNRGALSSADWSTFNGKYSVGGALGTPSSGTVTNLTGTASININGTVGATTASTGAFTTLSASSTVSGTGFTNYFASPPSIGSTAAGTGAFTTLSASSTVSGTGFSTYLASPPAIGGTTAAAGSFTALSATSNLVTSVTAATSGLTTVTAVTGSLTLATGGVTLATQTAASGSVWRVRAYGAYAAASSANVRQLTMSCYWGTTQLTAITTGNVLASTAQTTPWQVEFEISTTSTTAAWNTGVLSSQVTSATIPLNTIATPASVTVTAGAQTLDFRVGQTGTATSGDTINVHQVTIERIK